MWKPDKMRGLLLLCVLGSVLAQKELDVPSPTPGTPGTFLIMAPKVVRPGRPLTMSVSILDPAAASVQVTATLMQNGRPTGTPASGDFSPSADGTLELVVPGDLTAAGTYKLKVEGTGGLTFTEEKDLTFNSKSSSIFVQTDKGKYKPGQTVKMRALAVDAELKTKKEQFDIDIFDPQGNKIVQWRGLQNDDGIVEKEFPLSDQPLLGDWKIVAMLAGGDQVEQPFGVEEYVLPKFEVTISTNSFFAQTEDNLQGTFNAKYTYGKNVEGQGKVTAKLRSVGSNFRPTDNSIELNAIAMTEGSGSFQFSRRDIENLYSYPSQLYYGSYQLELIVEVTEGLTGNTQESTKALDLVQTKYKLEFFNTAENFKPGLQYTAYLRTSYHDGTPMLGMDLSNPVTLTKSYGWDGPTSPPPEELTIPQSGVIKIVMDVPSTANSMSLSVTYNDVSETAVSHSANKAESPSSTYIQVTTSTPEVMAGEVAQFTVKSTSPISYFSYQVLSRGNIVVADRVDVSPDDTQKSFTVPTTAQMAPSSRMVVYWMTDTGEVCNDGLTFTVKGAFENQVSVSYDKDRAEPAEDIAVTVRADPDSLVALLTVDQSVLLLASGNDITQEKVLAELEEYDPAEDGSSSGGPGIMWRRKKRSIWWPMPTSGADAHAVFENAGVIVITDAMVYQKQPDYWWDFGGPFPGVLDNIMFGPQLEIAAAGAGVDVLTDGGGGGTALQEVKQVRSFFPETWLWSNATAGPAFMDVAVAGLGPDEIRLDDDRLKEVTRVRSFFPETWLWESTVAGYHWNLNTVDALYHLLVVVKRNSCQTWPWSSTCQLQLQTLLEEGAQEAACRKSNVSAASSLKHGCSQKELQVTPFFEDGFMPDMEFMPAAGKGDSAGGWGGGGGGGLQEVKLYAMYDDAFMEEMDMEIMPAAAAEESLGGRGSSGGLQEVKRIRSFFPETWLWTNTTAGPDGTAVFASTVPDTITSWVASAFALNDISGLGVSDTPASMEAFRPFFVSLNLPYSVVNKEETAIQALVFNYMDVEMDVTVTLEGSDGFMHIVMDTNDVNAIGTEVAGDQAVVLTVPAGTSRSKSFPIIPKRFGAVTIKVKAQSTLAADAVERQLLVEPEGEQKEYTKSFVLDLDDNTRDVTKYLTLGLPLSGMVAGSAYGRVSVMGDMMGSTISGLDSLLQMPYGCGEQTMITFAPNVYVMYYLDQTDQVTPEIEDKALKFMSSGYQRELTYTHNDGSFSAFGTQDDSGSTWLSAFVIKSFAQAVEYIYIDPKVLAKTVRWLIRQQQDNGVFSEPGRVIHKEMQGGLSSDVTMTSYVLVSLMEYNNILSTMDAPDSDKVDVTMARDRAVSFLEGRLDSETDVYTVVTMTYALTEGGQKYWKKPESTAPPPVSDDLMWTPPYHDPPSADVEMTAYALLTYLARDDMIDGIPIMKWLSEQRNAYGGYSSTQDTVVGLQALAYFAAGVRAGGLDMTVTITSDTDAAFSHTFTVNDQNAIVLQQVEIPNLTGTLTARAQGTGMGLLQLFVRYNVDVVDPTPSFNLVATVKDSDNNFVTCETCGAYQLGGSSGMAVMEIGIPSGFYVEDADLMALVENQNLPTLKRAERSTDNKKAVLYFDEMNASPTCVTLTSRRSMPVAKTQPSVVKVYDYYKPDVKASNVYQSETLKNTNICDVCDDCTGCRTRRSPQNGANGGPALVVDTLLGMVLVLLTRLLGR
ncbi:CD109 antigen-like [Branchiostoma floridae]|uniref:CD109 antigen-like n=1 Tax=Branchiostoma floridae TaxID=7739 RepID=A0A9J7MU02_BRAFL|nr:CD109 antigen-like [Branchiostoma floridae]